jgi:hypothetical protein
MVFTPTVLPVYWTDNTLAEVRAADTVLADRAETDEVVDFDRDAMLEVVAVEVVPVVDVPVEVPALDELDGQLPDAPEVAVPDVLEPEVVEAIEERVPDARPAPPRCASAFAVARQQMPPTANSARVRGLIGLWIMVVPLS